MHISDIVAWIYPLITGTGLLIYYFISRGSLSKETEIMKDDLIDTRGKKITDLLEEVENLKQRDNDQQVMIDKMRSEIDMWKNLPIRQLSEDYHQIAIAVTDMNKLLKVLAEKKNVKSNK